MNIVVGANIQLLDEDVENMRTLVELADKGYSSEELDGNVYDAIGTSKYNTVKGILDEIERTGSKTARMKYLEVDTDFLKMGGGMFIHPEDYNGRQVEFILCSG